MFMLLLNLIHGDVLVDLDLNTIWALDISLRWKLVAVIFGEYRLLLSPFVDILTYFSFLC